LNYTRKSVRRTGTSLYLEHVSRKLIEMQ